MRCHAGENGRHYHKKRSNGRQRSLKAAEDSTESKSTVLESAFSNQTQQEAQTDNTEDAKIKEPLAFLEEIQSMLKNLQQLKTSDDKKDEETAASQQQSFQAASAVNIKGEVPQKVEEKAQHLLSDVFQLTDQLIGQNNKKTAAGSEISESVTVDSDRMKGALWTAGEHRIVAFQIKGKKEKSETPSMMEPQWQLQRRDKWGRHHCSSREAKPTVYPPVGYYSSRSTYLPMMAYENECNCNCNRGHWHHSASRQNVLRWQSQEMTTSQQTSSSVGCSRCCSGSVNSQARVYPPQRYAADTQKRQESTCHCPCCSPTSYTEVPYQMEYAQDESICTTNRVSSLKIFRKRRN